jgi:hypothetical protein
MSVYNWSFFDKLDKDSWVSAQVIVPLIAERLQPKSVVDIGCGLGQWLRVFLDLGIQDILGLDGHHLPAEKLYIASDQFLGFDLRSNFAEKIGRRFDLAISLEVAEHIPSWHASRFIEGLTQLSDAVLFSAAVPFQSGTEHINEQWPEYWANEFHRFGYHPIDCIRPAVWYHPDVAGWYKQNVLLYLTEDRLKEFYPEYIGKMQPVLSIIHPYLFLWICHAQTNGLHLHDYSSRLQQFHNAASDYTNSIIIKYPRCSLCREDCKPALSELAEIKKEIDSLVSERDVAINLRNSVIAERDAIVVQRDSAVKKCEALVAERDAAISQRDNAIAERNKALAERDVAIG